MSVASDALQRLAAATDVGTFTAELNRIGFDSASGLAEVLVAADAFAWDAPIDACAVATHGRGLAQLRGWDDIVPRARYMEARGALLSGRLDDARQMLLDARAGFAAAGDESGARRTALGLAHLEATTGNLAQARSELAAIVGAPVTGDEDRLLAAKAGQNLGAIEIMSGSYERAIELLADAEAAYAELGLPHERVDAITNRATALLGLGRASAAIEALDTAMVGLDADGAGFALADLLETTARAHLLGGGFSDALALFERALTILRAQEIDERAAATQLGLADTWLTLNIYDDAAREYEAVAAWCRDTGARSMEPWAELGWGLAEAGRERPETAADALRRALVGFEQTDQISGAIRAALALASLQVDDAARRSMLEQASALGDAAQRPVEQVYIEIAMFDAGFGESHLETARHLVGALAFPRLAYEVDVRLARVARVDGDIESALSLLRSAVAAIEATRGMLASERHRRTYLLDRLAAHRELVSILTERGDEASLREAFTVAEQARSRSLLDTMAGLVGPRRSATDDPETVARLDQLSVDLEALYNGVLGDDELRGVHVVAADLSELNSAIESTRGELRAVPAEAIVDLSTLQELLVRAKATLVSFHEDDDRLMAFLVDVDGLSVIRLDATTTEIRALVRRLDAQLSRFRAGQGFTARWVEPMLVATTDVLVELDRHLVQPLGDVFGSGRRVVVVASQQLQSVPFAALGPRGNCVVDRAEIIFAPSASAWVCASDTPHAYGRALVVAVADDRAPGVRGEAASIAARFGDDVSVLLDAVATRERVVSTSGPSVLHLACHGVFHPTHPMFSALRLGDGWLTGHELADADLVGSLVVLSACESGRSTMLLGDEMLGLPRALIQAGARDVIASGWLAHDESTAELMINFYEELAGGAPPSAALRTAQLALRATHAHPFYWAAFSIVGAGWQPVPRLAPQEEHP